MQIRTAAQERVGVRTMFLVTVNVQGACFAAVAARHAADQSAKPLDLASADALLLAMGGELTLEAEVGQGGTLSARFPLDLPMDDLTERRLAGRLSGAA